MNVQFKLTNLVLDFQKVQDRANAAKRRTMIRAGAILRGVMRRRLRKRKSKSSPGQAPSIHVDNGDFGLKTIRFDYDSTSEEVIVGPVGGRSGLRTDVPGILEYGGYTSSRTSRRIRKKTGKSVLRVYVKARPYSNPALGAFVSSYPDLWKDTIK